jgi:hypothetical protein
LGDAKRWKIIHPEKLPPSEDVKKLQRKLANEEKKVVKSMKIDINIIVIFPNISLNNFVKKLNFWKKVYQMNKSEDMIEILIKLKKKLKFL